MIKKIITSTFASVFLLSQLANAEIKLGDKGSLGTIAFNAGYNSLYIWRGIDQNSGSGSPYIGADLTTPIGLYIGTWTASSNGGGTNAANTPNQEVDIYGGIAKTFGPITADIGVIEYRYPGSNRNNTPINFLEYYAKLKLAPDKSPFSIQLAYYLDDTEGAQAAHPTTGAKLTEFGKYYYEISGSLNLPEFSIASSYGKYNKETDTITVTISKSMFDMNFAVSYIDADRDSNTTSISSKLNSDKNFVVANVSKTF